MARYGHSFMTKPRFKTKHPRWTSRLHWRLVEPKGVVRKVKRGRVHSWTLRTPIGAFVLDRNREPVHVTYEVDKYAVSLLAIVNAVLPFFRLRFDATEGVIVKRRLERRYRHERVLEDGRRQRLTRWVKAWPQILFEGTPAPPHLAGPLTATGGDHIKSYPWSSPPMRSPLEVLEQFQTTRPKRRRNAA